MAYVKPALNWPPESLPANSSATASMSSFTIQRTAVSVLAERPLVDAVDLALAIEAQVASVMFAMTSSSSKAETLPLVAHGPTNLVDILPLIDQRIPSRDYAVPARDDASQAPRFEVDLVVQLRQGGVAAIDPRLFNLIARCRYATVSDATPPSAGAR